MERKREDRRGLRRRRWIQFGAVLIALALVLMTVLTLPIADAFADTREDAVKQRDESQAKVEQLQDEVEGIDAELTALFASMEQTKLDVANARIELADAEAEQATAERHLEAVRAELEAAQAELADLKQAVSTSRSQESTLTQAVGDMARDLYRGNSTSPLQVVMSTDGVGEISSRAAAATALGRMQSRALDTVRSGLVIQENQAERQDAVTTRIGELEAEAEAAFEAAAEARQAVADQLESLETLYADQEAAESKWNARKAEAEQQIAEHDAAAADATARIAEIDRQNNEKQVVFENPTGGQASAPSPGALFAQPFRFGAPVTSYFGWRVHPIFGVLRLHTGTDFGAGCGTAQYATRAGVVTEAGFDSGLGNYVTINHGLIGGQSMVTQHGHLQSIAVSVGQAVDTGTVVGYTGSTGNSTGCHLHLNLLIDGSYASILDYM